MFRFKKFAVEQDRTPMKVGTDGVLLGAWTPLRGDADRRILDVGTGTGVIALMLAQRARQAAVTGIDIADVSQAAENFAASPWGDRLEAVQVPVQAYEAGAAFDLIVSNPPFYVDALRSPDAGRNVARHNVGLSFDELATAVVRLLDPVRGRFALILPPDGMARFEHAAWGRLWPVRRCEVHSTPSSGVKRIMALFAPQLPAEQPAAERLVIEEAPRCFTAEYRELTGDFYLKF